MAGRQKSHKHDGDGEERGNGAYRLVPWCILGRAGRGHPVNISPALRQCRAWRLILCRTRAIGSKMH